ncbi:MAG: hypothetical protein K2K41_02325 [Ruminiclostridium sp.]|nr:hypothetical protein [Ruminiclostridium sp.]
MKFNKPIAVFLTAAILVSFAGCSDGGKQPENTADNTKAPVQQTVGGENTAGNGNTVGEENTNPPEAETDSTEADTKAPAAEEPGSVPDSYREDGESGIKIISRNGHYMGLMGCWGTFENCERYADAVNKAAAALPNVKVYNMVIPTSSEFYVPEDITGFTSSQKDKIDHIADKLSGVTSVDAYSALKAHTEESIYTRTDHHWQPLGAYYAAEQFAKAAGVGDKFAPLSQYTEVVKDGYMGSLYNYSKSEKLKSDPEPFTLYISPNDKALKTTYYDTAFQNGYESDLFVTRDGSNYYCSFLGSDDRIAKIETDCDNGKTLVVMKESYGNGLIPFLTQCYQTIYVCDARYFDLNAIQFCKDVNATDLLFAVCTFTPAGPNVKEVERVIG